MTPARSEELLAYEVKITAKARELLGDVPPEFNIWPTRELVRQAWAHGYDLVKVPRSTDQERANAND